jgi:cytochrome c oxidase subunit 2
MMRKPTRFLLTSGLLMASLLLLAGCRTAQSTMFGYGPPAKMISHLSWLMTILFLITTLVMWVLIGWPMLRRRGSLDTHAPIDESGGEIWIAIGGLAVPLMILTVLFVLGLNLLTDFPIHGMHGAMPANAAQRMQPEILITGHQWWWQIEYLNTDKSMQFATSNELHLPVGRPINIEVVTDDVMHSFWIPALHGKVDLIPGHPNFIRLQASQTGSFVGQCAEYCGSEHARMRLLAVVQSPAQYAAWQQAQRQPGATPTTPSAIAGEQTFLAGPCSMCHTVRGTLAGGRVAPDLTHIGSRRYIAANSYINNNAYLEAWVTHAQSLKPGAQMPNLTQFTGTQLNDLVSYLRQLQ